MSKPDVSDRSIKRPDPTAFELPHKAVEESLGGKAPTSFKVPDYSSLGLPSNRELLAQLGPNDKAASKDAKDSDLLKQLNDRATADKMSSSDLANHLASTLSDTDFKVLGTAMKKVKDHQSLSKEEKEQLHLAETADRIMDIAFLRDGKEGLKNLTDDLSKAKKGRFTAKEDPELPPLLKDDNGKPKLGAMPLTISDNGQKVGKLLYNFEYDANDPIAKEVKEKAENLKGCYDKNGFTDKDKAATVLHGIKNDTMGAALALSNYLAGVSDEDGIHPDTSVRKPSGNFSYWAVGDGMQDKRHLRFRSATGAVEPNR
jgi:hypothetical protein